MPDDENDDWFAKMPSVIEARPEPLAETAPHRGLDYLGGREAGYSDGVEAIVASLARELGKAGLSPTEAKPICSRVRESALRRG